MFLGTNMCGHNHVWAQSCMGTNVSGHNRVWAQSCLGTIVSLHNHVRAQTCLGTIVSGHNRVGSSMYGHNRVVSVRIPPVNCKLFTLIVFTQMNSRPTIYCFKTLLFILFTGSCPLVFYDLQYYFLFID